MFSASEVHDRLSALSGPVMAIGPLRDLAGALTLSRRGRTAQVSRWWMSWYLRRGGLLAAAKKTHGASRADDEVLATRELRYGLMRAPKKKRRRRGNADAGPSVERNDLYPAGAQYLVRDAQA